MKKLIVIMILIIILALIITSTLIINKRNNSKITIKPNVEVSNPTTNAASMNNSNIVLYNEYHLPINDNTKGATINQTYNVNPINFTKEEYKDDHFIGWYFQIDGLKNEKIENEINEKLKNTLIEYGKNAYKSTKDYYDRLAKDPNTEYENTFSRYKDDEYIYNNNYLEDDWYVKVDQAVLSNYSNVLSIMTSQQGNFVKYGPNHSYVNVNLENGEELHIEEIFTKDVNAFEKYKESIYTLLPEGEIDWVEATNTWTNEEGEEETYTYFTDGTYERVNVEKQIKLVNKFKYTKDISFGFTDKNLIIEFENLKSVIEFSEHPEHIAIFNRYANASNIYDGRYDAPTGIPAFHNYNTGDQLVSAKFMEKDGKVLLDYKIKYEGDHINRNKYRSLVYMADDIIKNRIKLDVNEINKTYNGNNYILYNGEFEIRIVDVGITNEEYKKYEKYIKTGTTYFYYDYNPKVYEISSNDLEILQSDYIHNLYDGNEYNNSDDYYDKDTERWIEHKKFVLKKYLPFYREIAKDDYEEKNYDWSDEPYFSPIRKAYTIITGNDGTTSTSTTVYESNLLKFIVNDNVALANDVYDNNSEIANTNGVRKDNFIVSCNGYEVKVNFPYYHTGTESWENYYTEYGYFIPINTITDNYDTNIYISRYDYY